MGPTPARPAVDDDDTAAIAPPAHLSAAFPELDEYVDLVSELEEILRGGAAAEEPAQPFIEQPAEAEPVEAVATLPAPPANRAVLSPAPPRPAPLRTRARSPRPELEEIPGVPPLAADGGPPAEDGFWQVDDHAWAASPAWSGRHRRRGADLFIIGALVVLIAGGGAYSAIQLGDGGNPTLADNGIADNASRAEAGLGVAFTPLGRASLLRNDPTLPVPSLDATVAGAEVAPLPVIIEPPVEATAPVFLADAAATAPAGPAAAPDATFPLSIGGPLVPFDPADLVAGVPATTTTTVTTWVNMRAGPDNADAVVMVVSPQTAVTVRTCDYWCSVTVDGRDGYIFQDFLVAHP